MKKNFAFVLLVGFFTVGLFAQAHQIKIASIAPANSPWSRAQDTLVANILRRTNNQVKLTFIAMNTQGGEIGTIKRMRTVRPGQKAPIDGAVFTNIGLAELLPNSTLLTLVVPGLFENQAELDHALSEVAPHVEKEVGAEGYVLLGWLNVGWATFYAKETFRNPAQLKRLRLDAGGFGSDIISNLFKAAGYSVEAVPPQQFLQSIKSPNGIQASYSVPMLGYIMGWHKSLPNILDMGVCPVMSAVVMSKATWDKLTPDQQSVIKSEFKNAQETVGKEQEKADREYLDKMASEGAKLIKLSTSEKAELVENFKKDAEVMSKTTNSPIDIKFYNEILGIVEKYRAGQR